jgi:hypothetical protein
MSLNVRKSSKKGCPEIDSIRLLGLTMDSNSTGLNPTQIERPI